MRNEIIIILLFITTTVLVLGAIYSYKSGFLIGKDGIIKPSVENYISKGEECDNIRFICPAGFTYFRDEVGCGCKKSREINESDQEYSKSKFCEPDQRLVSVCTKEYNPVCGWFNRDIQCIKFPCATTYSNACMACQDSIVEFYTSGECPI